MGKARITAAMADILKVFLDDPRKSRHGFDLMKETGFSSGKIYPVLARLAEDGWLVREREDFDQQAADGPVRYLYRINLDFIAAASQEISRLGNELPLVAALRRRLAIGRLLPSKGII